ncbi:MAG: AtaL-like protein [Blastomonas sp.]
MIYSTATVPVNSPGEALLTREQVWRGLELKARDARLFLPPGACTACDVTLEGPNFILREATIFDAPICEFVTFEPQSKVSFHQVRGPREGVIVNEIIEDAHGALALRFYCLIGLRSAEPGGAAEQAEQATFDSADRGYAAALRATLARTRQLVADGLIT